MFYFICSALFGSEDQDYRGLMDVDQRKLDIFKQKGWVQYRYDYLGEFFYEIEYEKRDMDYRSFFDMDYRRDVDFRSKNSDVDLRSVSEFFKNMDILNVFFIENREYIFEQIEKRRKFGELIYEKY